VLRHRLLALPLAVLAAVALWLVVIAPALDSPERRVAAYLEATGAGNERAALEAWVVYEGGVYPRQAMLDRRRDLTRELVALRVGGSYALRSIDYWTTCCDPHRINESRNAGLARVHVAATDAAGIDHELVFEVWARKVTWWGDAAGETRHDWTLYEVHREGVSCVLGSPIIC